MLVLAIGLLGLASLQAVALRHNQGAYERTLATLQAYEMADRIRTNLQGAGAGSYVWTGAYGAALPTQDCVTSECATADAVAGHDIREWMNGNTRLPNGWGRITRNGDIYAITIFWDDERTGAAGTDCSGDTSVDLTCLTINFQP